MLPMLSNRTSLLSGGEDPKKKSLSYEQINLWSDFVESNPETKDLNALYRGFVKKYPKAGIDENTLKNELALLMQNTQQAAKKEGTPLYTTVNTGFAFPRVMFNGKDMGRVNAMMQTRSLIPTPKNTYPKSLISKKIPSGDTDYWFDEEKGLVGYEDPHEGVIKYAEKSAINSPALRKQSAIIAVK